jgi:hypothetical protein
MFGASEDRARQLAYRKRRERVTSGSSSSTYVSLSSASPISQRSRVSSTLGQETIRSYPATQHSSLHTEHSTFGYTNSLRFQANKAPLSATEAQDLQIEQHRLQAEYLGQVLYDSLSLATTDLQPRDASMPAMNIGHYRILGKPTMSRHVRNLTAPVPSIYMLSGMASNGTYRLGPPLLSRTSQEAIDLSLRAQSTFFLRGGGDADDEWNPNRSIPTTEGTQNTFPMQQLQPANGYAGSSNTARDLSRPYMTRYTRAPNPMSHVQSFDTNQSQFSNQNYLSYQTPSSYQTLSSNQNPYNNQVSYNNQNPLSNQSLLSNQILYSKSVALSNLDGTRAQPIDLISSPDDQNSRAALERARAQSLVSGRRSTSAPSFGQQQSGHEQQRYAAHLSTNKLLALLYTTISHNND